MKVNESKYISSNKNLFNQLLKELLNKYEYASILVTDSVGTNYAVSKSGTSISDNSLYSYRGYVIKAYKHGYFSEYSSDMLTEELIPYILETVEQSFVAYEGNSEDPYDSVDEESATFVYSSDYEIDPPAFGDDKVIAELTRIHEEGMKLDERLVNVYVSVSYQKFSKLFLSPKKDMLQNICWSNGFVISYAKRGDEVKEYYSPASMLGGFEIVDKLKDCLKISVKGAIELLNSKPMIPGEYECICTPEVTGMIVHEAFGHGVEMDMFVKDRAKAREYIGEYVASKLVTMHDGNAVNQVATYCFDDEGVRSKDTVVIDKGVLVGGFSDLQSAMRLKTAPTGNGRRQDYSRKAYARMTNTYFEPGTDDLEDMIKSISYGFMLENASSGMEDPKNWGIQCMVNVAREIKDGKFTGNIFSPIVLTGYVPDLLKSISAVSKDFELGGSGYCGKGYKEWVKVSDGGPYIKAKIRLG